MNITLTEADLRILKAALERSIEYGPLPSDKGVAEMHLLGKIDGALLSCRVESCGHPLSWHYHGVGCTQCSCTGER